MKNFYTILSVTGSDSTGGSGIQADIKTIYSLGGYAVTAITAINGSGAKITVRTVMNYWSNTQYYENGYPRYEGVFVQFYVNPYRQAGFAWTQGREQKPIILVRDAN